MADRLRVHEGGADSSLTFDCGSLPVYAAIQAAGHEPNGYFWESVVQYLLPTEIQRIDLDSEAGRFAAYGDSEVLARVRETLQHYVSDPARVTDLIARAEADGFSFDD